MLNKPVKILYMIPNLNIGGAEKLLLQLITSLNSDKFQIILITLEQKGDLFNNLPINISKTYSTKNPFKIFSILKKEKPDIFHSHLWKADFIGIPISKLAGIKQIFTTKHNLNYFYGLKKILKPFDILIMKLTTNIICISNAVKNYYQSDLFYKKNSFTTIYNGIDLEPFQKIHKTNKNREPFYFLTVANLIKQKGHLEFLDILYELKNINFKWHLVGSGPKEKEIRNKIKKLNLEKKVIIHGKQKDVMPFYQQADLFILPSLWEGFGLVLIEAMASGVPVFASKVDEIKVIINDKKNGILFNVLNINQTKKQLLDLLEDDKLRISIYDQGKIDASRFSLEYMTKYYKDIYTR